MLAERRLDELESDCCADQRFTARISFGGDDAELLLLVRHAGALLEIGAIDAGRGDADQDLLLAGARAGRFAEPCTSGPPKPPITTARIVYASAPGLTRSLAVNLEGDAGGELGLV